MSNYIELPDGSGVSTATLPLPKGHWIYHNNPCDPPAAMRTYTDDPMRKGMEEAIRAGAKWAIRGATWFNIETRGLYCKLDAMGINEAPLPGWGPICVPVDRKPTLEEMDQMRSDFFAAVHARKAAS